MLDFDKRLVTGVERGASDLHLKSNAPPILRIHGRLIPQQDLGVISVEEMDGIARRCCSERMYTQLRDGKEIDTAYAVPNFGRFRVNMFRALGRVRAVLRAIPSKKPKFEDLGLPPVLEALSMERRGLVLVTGITGSGKSTTLAAMIDYINRTRNDHIITIEDPIEFTHEDINCVISQREIGHDSPTPPPTPTPPRNDHIITIEDPIEFTHEDINCVISQREIGHDSPSFATALRAALREDPDVSLVGERRDPETMSVALHAAETGPLG